MRRRLRALREGLSDERGEIRGLFLKLGLAAILLALIIAQMGPILANRMEIGGITRDAADIGVNRYKSSGGDMAQVRESVRAALEERDARLLGEVSTYKDEAGNQVLTFTARKITRTWLFYHVGFLAPYTEVTESVAKTIYN